MTDRTIIAAAGNVLPAALATLRAIGYVVTNLEGGGRQADNGKCTLIGDDLLQLLGLVKLLEARRAEWRPTDGEIDEYLAFDVAPDA